MKKLLWYVNFVLYQQQNANYAVLFKFSLSQNHTKIVGCLNSQTQKQSLISEKFHKLSVWQFESIYQNPPLSCWYFEFVILVRRLCFSLVVSFPFGSDRVTILLILLVLTLFLCIEMYYQVCAKKFLLFACFMIFSALSSSSQQ